MVHRGDTLCLSFVCLFFLLSRQVTILDLKTKATAKYLDLTTVTDFGGEKVDVGVCVCGCGCVCVGVGVCVWVCGVGVKMCGCVNQ